MQGKRAMKHPMLALVASALLIPSAFAAPHGDVMTPIRQFIDGFNKGDTKSAFAAYAIGDILIVDEFAPHRWFGPRAAQDWAAAYDKHAQATGVSDGSVKYGKPTRTEIEDDVAYVIVPTVYNYKDHGAATTEEGQITVVLHKEAGGWKISAWTWTGVKPHRAK
jgi:ketosteroid isomerase-like protein